MPTLYNAINRYTVTDPIGPWVRAINRYTATDPIGPWVRQPADVNPISNQSTAARCHCQLQCHSAAETGAARCNHTIHGQLNSIGQLQLDAGGGGGGGGELRDVGNVVDQGRESAVRGELIVLAMMDRWMTAPGVRASNLR